MKSQITEHTGHTRDGWGKAVHSNGYSHLVKLDCGHNKFVANSKYKGVGSFVVCGKCEDDKFWNRNAKK